MTLVTAFDVIVGLLRNYTQRIFILITVDLFYIRLLFLLCWLQMVFDLFKTLHIVFIDLNVHKIYRIFAAQKERVTFARSVFTFLLAAF